MTMWKPLLWPFKVWLPVGVGLILLAGIAKYIRDLYIAITGRPLE
jgi:TRAP-type mannitol/chloroaromatic compound transport system permease small subunit